MSASKRTLSEFLDGQNVTSPRPVRRRLASPPHLTLCLPTRGAPPPPPPPFQQPVQLLSFSYTSQPTQHDGEPTTRTRTLEWSDASLRYYVPPPGGADLSYRYASWVRRPEERPRLDGLLAACMRRECAGTRAAAGVVTWRGVVTKILTAPYEEREGWALNVMRVRGTLYLEEHLSDKQLDEKSALEGKQLLMTYYGYAFESYCTADAPRSARPANGWGCDVDTNVQWCSVVKTKLGKIRLLLGGEVDCVRDRYTGQPDTFVELKTSLALRPGNPNDAARFEKKLLKFHMQSFILGVPEIVVGFRTPAGHLQTVQTFRTLDIPRLIRGRQGAWNPAVCLAWGSRVFEFLHQTVVCASEDGIKNEEQEESTLWRATFTPGEGITVRRLDEVDGEDVRGGEERVGFLPRWYWDEIRNEGMGGCTQSDVPVEESKSSNDGMRGWGKGGTDPCPSGDPRTHVMGWKI